MEEISSPPPCPKTVTVRRNPHRRARPTPSSMAPVPIMPLSPTSDSRKISSFPTKEILSIQLPPNPNLNPNNLSTSDSLSSTEPENLRVFLRIRPLAPNGAQITKKQCKNAWPKSKNGSREKPKKKTEICVSATDCHSVTVSPPASLKEVKRVKTEVYGGFSEVFSAESTQDEVYAKMVNPLVEDFLRGKCGMLAALGPSGSGKTHTVFGSPREPGMIPLALRQIFSEIEGFENQSSKVFYLSMFEISSERGKAEGIFDLFQDTGDACMQSTVKGVKEVTISNVQQAESLVTHGMSKRSTARTNSNNQSSRSQCIISIRSNRALLTVVDLAGAERVLRTGNQGTRLMESNFINNTSMVFGLCLRSLLEHQKNPKKPLRKHFQNSLLTRYLRDYLEGKRRMALILTVKSGVEDYLDTSFLLRQASPYMKIKFNNAEEPFNSISTKRNFQAFPRIERLKRMKLSSIEACQTNEGNEAGDGYRFLQGEALPKEIKEFEPQDCLIHPGTTTKLDMNDGKSLGEGSIESEKERKNVIMQNFAKAIWNVLKQYKGKLEVAENQIQILTKSIASEKAQRFVLETELKDLKSNLLVNNHDFEDLPRNVDIAEDPQDKRVDGAQFDRNDSGSDSCVGTTADSCSSVEGCPLDSKEDKLNAGVSSLKLDESESMANQERSDSSVNNAGVVTASSIAVEDFEEQGYQFTNQESEDFERNTDIGEDPKNMGTDDTQFDRIGSDSGPSKYAVSSPKPLVGITNGSCSSVEGSQSDSEKDKKQTDQPAMVEEGAELAKRCDACSEIKSEPNDSSSSGALDAEKPKRGLLPASSILLNNISSLEFEDEYEKPKVNNHDFEDLPRNVDIAEDPQDKRVDDAQFDRNDSGSDSCVGTTADSCSSVEDCPLDSEEDKLNAGVSSLKLDESESIANQERSDTSVNNAGAVTASSIAVEDFEEQGYQFTNQESKDFERNADIAEDSKNMGTDDTQFDRIDSDSGPSKYAVSSPKPFVGITNDSCSSVEGSQSDSEKDKKRTDQSAMVDEGAELAKRCDACSEIKSKPNDSSSSGALNAEKPKRRLLPASSILLKNISSLEFEDEYEKPKGGRGEKKLVPEERNRTQGSISLLRLLRTNLHL